MWQFTVSVAALLYLSLVLDVVSIFYVLSLLRPKNVLKFTEKLAPEILVFASATPVLACYITTMPQQTCQSLNMSV